MSKNIRGLSSREASKKNLYDAIVEATTGNGLAAGPHQEVASRYMTGKAAVYGTASFYEFLRGEHREKKIFICDGTACLVSGKQERLRKELLKFFTDQEIGAVTCLGQCHTNNAFLYNNATWSTDDLSQLGEILKRADAMKPVMSSGTNSDTPSMMAPFPGIESYYRPVLALVDSPETAVAEITRASLRGRGGAGFPFHVKLKASGDAAGDKKYVVCNADEGDPGAFSDRWLLEERPHAVLAGMLATGLITGADTGVLYIRGEYPESVTTIKGAIEELQLHGITGVDAGGTGRPFHFTVVEGSGAYICGEETSLLNSAEGLRPEVRTRPPFPAVYGLYGKPTVLSNVETFANIPFILREGGDKWASMGTEKSAGTKLVSLDGAFLRPGIYEVKMGTPLSYLFEEMGGGVRYPVKAWQIGGPLGGIVPATKVNDLTLDFESFASNGFLLGHAGVVSVPSHFAMSEFIKHLFDFTARESCGKCFPCRIGATRGYELIDRATGGQQKISRELLDDLLETMEAGSLCALGGGLPLPVKNALEWFAEELTPLFD